MKINISKLLLTVTLLPMLLSCATITAPEEVKVVAQAALPEIPDQYAMAIERVGDVQVGWIDRIGDETLSSLVKEAQLNNRDLQVAAANVEQSWALAGQAGAGLSPSVSLASNAGGGGNIEGASAASFGLGLQASWEVDVWGRIRAGKQAAVLSAQSAEADYIYTQYSLAAAIAQAYFLAIEAGQQLAVTQKNLDALKEIDRIVKIQKEFGEATSQDVALSRSDLALTRASLTAARGAQRDALRALEALLGRYPAAELRLRTTLPPLPASPSTGLPSELLERRPDIIAAERSVAAAFNALDEAKAAAMPSITLTGSVGGASSQLSNLLNPTNVAWQAASNLVAPLIDGGLNDSQIAAATAKQKAAIASYAQAVLEAFKDVEGGLDQGVVLREQAADLKIAAIEASNALRIANLRYQEGEASLLDTLSVQQRVFSAEADVVTIKRAQLEVWLALNLALGGDWR